MRKMAMMLEEERLPETGYVYFMWLVMASSATVYIEPAPFDIAVMLLLLLGFLKSYLSYPKEVSIAIFFIGLFILGNLLSMFNLVNQVRGLWFLGVNIYMIILWAFFVGLLCRFRDKLLPVIFSGYSFAAVTSALIANLAFFELIPLTELCVKYSRATGFFKDPNVFGPFMIPIAMYSLVQIEVKRGWARIWWILVFLLTSLSVLLSFSRAAWLNYGVSIFTYMVLGAFNFKKRKVLINILAIVLIVGTLMASISIPHVNTIFFFRLGLMDYDNTRFSNQRVAFAHSFENILGIGPGQSEYTYVISTHNLYIRVFTENGVIGLLGFIAFIAVTLIRSLRFALWKNPYQTFYTVYTACILGLLANSLVIDSLHWRHFWLLLALPWMNPRNLNHLGGKEEVGESLR